MKLGKPTKATLLMTLCGVLVWGATFGAGYFWHERQMEERFGTAIWGDKECQVFLYNCEVPYQRTCSVPAQSPRPSDRVKTGEVMKEAPQQNAVGACDQNDPGDRLLCKLDLLEKMLKKLDCKPKK
jgi:hypothetical protein